MVIFFRDVFYKKVRKMLVSENGLCIVILFRNDSQDLILKEFMIVARFIDV